jgi:hypothetical protein
MTDVDALLREVRSGGRDPRNLFLVAQVGSELTAMDTHHPGVATDVTRIDEANGDFLGLVEVDHSARRARIEALSSPGADLDPTIPPLLRRAAEGVVKRSGWGAMQTPWLSEQ